MLKRILGISGFHHAMDHKKSLIAGDDIRFSRICQGMDSAAVLIENGKVIAGVAEERLNRQKHSNLLPVNAINYCLDQANCKLEDIDVIAHGFDYKPYESMYILTPSGKDWYEKVFSKDILIEDMQKAFGASFNADKLQCVDHHLSHAASAFYPSGFEKALVVVADGMGEMNGVTVYDANQNGIKPILQIPYNSSVGILYSLITLHLGFDFNADEYKTMGLAPYGDPQRYMEAFDKFIEFNDMGGFKLNLLQPETTDVGRETYQKTREYLNSLIFETRKDEEEMEQKHSDLASTLQLTTNKVMCHLVSHFMKKTGHNTLCLAGGVALNCVSNEHVLRLKEVEQVFIQPASGDDGTAYGAALWASVQQNFPPEKMGMPYWGPESSLEECKQAYEKEREIKVQREQHEDIKSTAKRIAALIAEGKVMSLYQGRMEFGPRALGNRSILADPRDPEMRDKVNAVVKLREGFRPFAPVVLYEDLETIYEPDIIREYPYMLVTLPTKNEYWEKLPAVTHVDGSARVQTIKREDNPLYYAIIEAFKEITGIPVLLNTSFNVKGQAIVHTAEEAVETFLNTGIDCLFMGQMGLIKE